MRTRTRASAVATAMVLATLLVVGCSDDTASSPIAPTPPQAPSPTSVVSGPIASVQSGPPVSIDDSYVSTTCGFSVLVAGSGKIKEIPLPGGHTKVLFPGFRVTLTNLATQVQVTLSATGSFHITELPNGNTEFVFTGRNTYDDPVAGRFLLLIGRFSEVSDPDFNVVQPLDGNGQIQDVCAMFG